jgi:glycosyltransferase involved in cell wall biosynthesis
MKLSIIIPARNEEKRIGKMLDDYIKFFSGKRGMEIFVVMDGCTDGTLGVVKKYAAKHPIVKYKYYDEPLGKGGAVIKGFGLVDGDLIAFADADGATPPGELLRLAGLIRGYDGVIGSRWMKGSEVGMKQPFARRVASRGFNLLVRTVLGLPFQDTQCSAKVFSRRMIRSVLPELKVTNFAVDACMLYVMKKKGYWIREIPIKWDDRGLSTVRMRKVIPIMFWTVLKVRLGM